MIITRSPLRISIGGGGTDLESYYKHNGGFLISAAINKYVYVTLTKPFEKGIYLKYSSIEKVNNYKEIDHGIIRETLKLYHKNDPPQIEITTLADIPSGTGLGSSSSFTNSLVYGLISFNKDFIDKKHLAEASCHIEINKLKEPIGKQDQYISAFGGVNCFSFNKNGDVKVDKLNISEKTQLDLEENLLLFFTGFTRRAGKILNDQKIKSEASDTDMISNLNNVKKMGYEIKTLLEKGNTYEFGKILDQHWQNKKKRSKGMSNPEIDEWYNLAIENGAVGGKLVGAGGGGFLLFYVHDRTKLRDCMYKCGLEEVHFSFDFEGTKRIL